MVGQSWVNFSSLAFARSISIVTSPCCSASVRHTPVRPESRALKAFTFPAPVERIESIRFGIVLLL